MVGRDGSRDQVLRDYSIWIQSQRELLKDLGELKGKDPVCFCAPLACHGDVLLELANKGGSGNDVEMPRLF